MTINIIFTGPPSAGKTTTFLDLQSKTKNLNFYPEISREIIQKSLSEGSDVLPWKNAKAFDQKVIKSRFEAYLDNQNLKRTQEGNIIKIYDRSPLDTHAYSKRFNCLTQDMIDICKRISSQLVFFFPFEERIYTQDAERKESPELAKQLQEYLLGSYQEFEQEIVHVDFDTIDKRTNFIIQEIENRLNLKLDR